MERKHIEALEDALDTLTGCRKLLLQAIPEKCETFDELSAIGYTLKKLEEDLDKEIGELLKEGKAED